MVRRWTFVLMTTWCALSGCAAKVYVAGNDDENLSPEPDGAENHTSTTGGVGNANGGSSGSSTTAGIREPDAGEDPPEPPWIVCDEHGSMLTTARSGYACAFMHECVQPGMCTLRAATCDEGILHTTVVERCFPGDNATKTCARVPDDACCVELYGCELPRTFAKLCAVGCEQLGSSAQAPIAESCAALQTLATHSPFPACQGNFVCGPHFEDLTLGAMGAFKTISNIYWCRAGIVQRATAGSYSLQHLP